MPSVRGGEAGGFCASEQMEEPRVLPHPPASCSQWLSLFRESI